MYVIKSYVRDFRDEETRKNDYSCYEKYEEVKTGEVFLGISLTKKVGVKDTFKDIIINTYEFKRDGLKYNLKYAECAFCDDIVETAYIPDTKQEYEQLKDIAQKVIRGDYSNQPERAKLLKKDGYDFFKVQSFVNYLLDSYRLFEKEDFERYLL